MVEIARVEACIRRPRFVERVYGARELEEMGRGHMRAQSAAARFAAKEAFAKLIGTGLRGMRLTEIEVLHDALGKPYYALSGAAADRAQGLEIVLSITHSQVYAVASAVGIGR